MVSTQARRSPPTRCLSADLFGLPATGKAIEKPGMSVLRVADGKIVHEIVSEATMGLMRQLGRHRPGRKCHGLGTRT